jgi:pimeloyl-ACP methyl ester carboxylesterase
LYVPCTRRRSAEAENKDKGGGGTKATTITPPPPPAEAASGDAEGKQKEQKEEEQQKEKEPVTIFLIHGAMASWQQFRLIIPRLSEHFHVVSFDAYGCGDSPKPKHDESAFATEELFEDLLEIYLRYKGPQNLLVGHSFGSSQIMRLAHYLQQSEAFHTHTRTYPNPPPPSDLLGLVLLASAYHVPDGGNPVFNLPLPVLNLIKPMISQVFKSKAIDKHADRVIIQDNARCNKGE